MNIEELKQALATDEGKALLREHVEKATDGLKNKNTELMGKLKKSKEQKDELSTRLDDLELKSIEGEDGEARKSGDVEKQIQIAVAKKDKELKALKEELDDYSQKLTASDTMLRNKIIKEGLSDALIENNIAKQHYKAISALLKSEYDIGISDAEGDLKPVVGDVPLNQVVKEWSQGDTGKQYVAAANNNGGGAKGSGGTANGGIDISNLSAKQKLSYGRKQQMRT